MDPLSVTSSTTEADTSSVTGGSAGGGGGGAASVDDGFDMTLFRLMLLATVDGAGGTAADLTVRILLFGTLVAGRLRRSPVVNRSKTPRATGLFTPLLVGLANREPLLLLTAVTGGGGGGLLVTGGRGVTADESSTSSVVSRSSTVRGSSLTIVDSTLTAIFKVKFVFVIVYIIDAYMRKE